MIHSQPLRATFFARGKSESQRRCFLTNPKDDLTVTLHVNRFRRYHTAAKASTLRLVLWATIGIFLNCGIGDLACHASPQQSADDAQQPADDVSPEDGDASATQPNTLPTVDLPPLPEEQQADLIARLGASRFQVREEAVLELQELGLRMLPALKQASLEHEDPEVRARASFVYRQIVQDDFDFRVEAFLAGQDTGDSFAGWFYVASLMGDSPEVREIFIAAAREHGKLVETFDGHPRDRLLELENVAHRIMRMQIEQMRLPQEADLMVVLWAIADPAIPISPQVQRLAISLMQKSVANELRKNAQLENRFLALVGNWIRRSRVDFAHDTLWLAMQWNMDIDGMTLGLRAAYEARDPMNVQAGLQAIARFGSRDDIPPLLPFLEDHRVPDGDAQENPLMLEVRVSDVAMAAIATLLKADLKELGFPAAVTHGKIAFDPRSVGFGKRQTEQRSRVRTRLDDLIQRERRANKLPAEVPEQ